jgi:NAD(P)-dependent dehydrogenase (short-subunit alcohol dehydrogenase family)
VSFDLELQNRRALVTGGTKGIGAAVVSVLQGAGANLVATARSVPEAPSASVHYIAADLTTAEGAPTLPKRFLSSWAESTLSSMCWEVQARRAAGLRLSTTNNGPRK